MTGPTDTQHSEIAPMKTCVGWKQTTNESQTVCQRTMVWRSVSDCFSTSHRRRSAATQLAANHMRKYRRMRRRRIFDSSTAENSRRLRWVREKNFNAPKHRTTAMEPRLVCKVA